MLQAGDTG